MATGAAKRHERRDDKRDERWMTAVTDALASGLRARLAAARQQGRGATDLGPPSVVAERMLATVPFTAPSPWNHVGPFYSTSGVARMLGGVTRQAVDDRRKRGRIVAVRTSDGVWLYPSFQFDGAGALIPGVARAYWLFRRLGPDDGGWTVASAMRGPQPELGGRSIVDHLADGGSFDAVAMLIERTGWSLAQ